jgi:probable phosphoglycerate mutase
MNNQYFLMRHGESEANVAGLIISYPETGCKRYGLSKRGRQQARLSALESGLTSDTVILSSDFLRARETAQIVAEVLACRPLAKEERLRERFFGQLEGSSASNYESVWRQDEVDPAHPWMGAEPAARVMERMSSVIQHLERVDTGRTFLLVSHGDPLRFLQLWVAGRKEHEHQSIAHFGPAEIRPLEAW